jgi:hypothetical protein
MIDGMSLQLTAGIDDGKGGVLDRVEVRKGAPVTLVARLQNRGKKVLSAVINATPLSHGEYKVEVRDREGRPVNLHAIGMCGTMSPLMEHEIFDLEPGATVPILVGAHFDLTPPGSYEARVRYEAHESDRVAKEDLDPAVVRRLKHFWTGTLHSNWVPVTILAAQPAP